MVTFKCKRGGNTVSFKSPDDIAHMRKHEAYEEVVETPSPVAQTQVIEPVIKKAGRPRKSTVL